MFVFEKLVINRFNSIKNSPNLEREVVNLLVENSSLIDKARELYEDLAVLKISEITQLSDTIGIGVENMTEFVIGQANNPNSEINSEIKEMILSLILEFVGFHMMNVQIIMHHVVQLFSEEYSSLPDDLATQLRDVSITQTLKGLGIEFYKEE